MTNIAKKITSFKRFFDRHETQIKKTAKFGASVLDDADRYLRRDPGIIDYVTFCLKLKGHYDEELRGSTWKSMGPKWVKCLDDAYATELIPLVRDVNEIILRGDIRFIVRDDFTLGWNETGDGKIVSVYCEEGQKKFVWEYLRELFWTKFGNCVVNASVKNYKVVFTEEPDIGTIDSIRSRDIGDELEKFLAKGYSRTILFYGPPGTGKSNIVRSIGKRLGPRGFKMDFHHLNNMEAAHASNLLNVLAPDVLIIEDIDHAQFIHGSSILAVMELLNIRGKLVLATTNEIDSLKDAVIRPGRFDKLIEIQKFDDCVLKQIVGDDSIYEKVKDYPIASVMELMKRIDVLGRDEALAGMEDIKVRVDRLEGKYRISS